MASSYNLGEDVAFGTPTIADYNFAASWPAWANKFTAQEPGEATTAYFYDSNGAAGDVKIAVYASVDDVTPTTLLGVSSAITLGGSAGFKSGTFSTPLTIVGGKTYFLAVLASGSTLTADYFSDGVTRMERHSAVPGSYASPEDWGATESGGAGGKLGPMYLVVETTVNKTPVYSGVASGSGASTTVPNPTNVVQDYELVLRFVNMDDAAATLTPSAGWTAIPGSPWRAADHTVYGYYQLVPAGTAAISGNDTAGSTYNNARHGISIRGVNPDDVFNTLEADFGAVNASGVAPVTPVLTTEEDGGMFVTYFSHEGASAVTWTPPSGMTERYDGENATGHNGGEISTGNAGVAGDWQKTAVPSAATTSIGVLIPIKAFNFLGTNGPQPAGLGVVAGAVGMVVDGHRISPATAPAAGNLKSTVVRIKTDGITATKTFRVVLYDSDGAAGIPKTLLRQSAEFTALSTDAVQWMEQAWAEGPITLEDGHVYHLAIHGDGATGCNNYYDGTAGPAYYSATDTYADGSLADIESAITASSGRVYSVYSPLESGAAAAAAGAGVVGGGAQAAPVAGFYYG